MKHLLRYKLILLTLVIIFCIGFYNVATLREVSKLEKKLEVIKVQLEDKEKELDKKIIHYDNKLNLSKIRANMEKKSMRAAKNIIYFEVDTKN